MAVNFEQSGRAHAILEELSEVIERGYREHTLQKSPHLTLLNEEWYRRAFRPVMAKWMVLWLEANHVAGLRTEHVQAYIGGDCAPLAGAVWDAAVEEAALRREAELAADSAGWCPPAEGTAAHAQLRLHAMLHLKLAANELTGKAMQLLNLAEAWLCTYLPHCLSMIDRVRNDLRRASPRAPPAASHLPPPPPPAASHPAPATAPR